MHIFAIRKNTDVHYRFDMWETYHKKKRNIVNQLAKEFGFSSREFCVLNASEFGFYANTHSHLRFLHECRKRSNIFEVRQIKRYSAMYEPIRQAIRDVMRQQPKQRVDDYFYHELVGKNNHLHTMYYRGTFYVAVTSIDMVYERVYARDKEGVREPLERVIDTAIEKRLLSHMDETKRLRKKERAEQFI